MRLLLRRLTVSAPRMSVRSALPWPLRWIGAAVVLGLQTLFNLITALRLRQHRRRNSAPGEAELMGQLLVDLTALSAILFYTGGATNPFVSFYLPGLAIAAAILPWRQVIALAVRSGSGTRYAAPDVDFREHQGEAAVSWGRLSFTCKPAE